MRFCLLLWLASCNSATFAPETLVDSLRVVSLTAEPPEVAPGESTTLRVSYFDPSRVGKTTVLWVGCQPDPQDLGRSACNEASILLNPTIITDYPPGLSLLGFGPTASFRPQANVFDVLPSDSTIRQSGSVGQVISIVIAEEVDPAATGEQLRGYFERIANKETPAVVALTRVLVSEKPQALRNQNPRIGMLLVDGQPHPVGAQLAFLIGQQTALTVSFDADVRERVVLAQPTGQVERQETVVGAWYSSSGRFSRERFDVTTLEPTQFTAPGRFTDDPVPSRRTGTVWLVVRDSRSGQAATSYPFSLCDPALPAPLVRTARLDGDIVTVEGDGLENVLDVIVANRALQNLSFDSARRVVTGRVPPGVSSGRQTLSFRLRNCQQTTGPEISIE